MEISRWQLNSPLKFILLSVAVQTNLINFIWGDVEGSLQYFMSFLLITYLQVHCKQKEVLMKHAGSLQQSQ